MSFSKLPVLRHGLMLRHEDILPDSAINRRIGQVRHLMREANVKSLLVYSDAAINGPVCYLTNYPCYSIAKRAAVVLGLEEGPFLFTVESPRDLPRVRRFTACDLEETKQFISAAGERAKELAKGGSVGLVNSEGIPAGIFREFESNLADLELKYLTKDFSALLAAKDQGGMHATKHAIDLARQGINALSGQMGIGKDLWEMAACADYRLRLPGCEDTNILLSSVHGQGRRPAYPTRTLPDPEDGLISYVAVQYARQWAAIGRTLSMNKDERIEEMLGALFMLQERVAQDVKAGMTLGELRYLIQKKGDESNLALAQDMPPAAGVGFDLLEYPTASEDLLKTDMVLQIALAVDSREGFTAMLVDMLQVSDRGGIWLTGKR